MVIASLTNARRPARRTAPHLISSHLDDTNCHAPTVESTTRALPLRTFWEWRPLSSRGLAVPRVPSLCGHSAHKQFLRRKKRGETSTTGTAEIPLSLPLSHTHPLTSVAHRSAEHKTVTRERQHTHCCVVSVSNKCVQSAHAPFLLRSSRCSTQPHAVSHSLTHSLTHSLPSLSLITLFPSLSLWTGGTETGTVHDS